MVGRIGPGSKIRLESKHFGLLVIELNFSLYFSFLFFFCMDGLADTKGEIIDCGYLPRFFEMY